MKFETAITALKQGSRIRRDEWEGFYLTIGTDVYIDEICVLRVDERSDVGEPYIFTQVDLFSYDWRALDPIQY